MNKAIDIFLRDMKPAIMKVAGDSVGVNKPCDLENAIFENSYKIAQCPFCDCDPELGIFDNGFEVVCKSCRARGPFVSDSCQLVLGDLTEFAGIIEPKLGEDIPIWNADLFNVLRMTRAAISAWWAIAKWNRREG